MNLATEIGNLRISQIVELYGDILESEWEDIPWKKLELSIFNLQQRIFRAEVNKDYRKVRSLQRTLLNKDSALLYSIRKVTQINKGRKTAGIDGMKILTNAERMALYYKLKNRNVLQHKAGPVRRVLIDKKNGKKRPLGIPTIIDRIYQNVVKLALEPQVEATFESTSYGFRPLRSTAHALARIHNNLRKHNRVWIFEGDFKSCFDTLSHNFILQQLGNFPAKRVVESWLKGGYLYNNQFNVTLEGTPQGGIISPILANIALHGMEQALNIKYKHRTDKNGNTTHYNPTKYTMVRYADDFVVLCKTKEDAEEVYNLLQPYLEERGLTLAPDKTKITHIDDGFDFLGFNIRNYHTQTKDKILIKPSKDSIKEARAKIHELFVKYRGKKICLLIDKLNETLRGIATHWSRFVAKKALSDLDDYVWKLTLNYLRRRHPNKSWKWIRNKYLKKDYTYQTGRNYILTDPDNPEYQLMKVSTIPIRYVKQIKYKCTPYDSEYSEYIYNKWGETPFKRLYPQ